MLTSRGPLFPKRLPDFHRLSPPAGLEQRVRWFWITSWELPDGEVSRQQLIAYPAVNVVVEPGMVGLSGPATRVSHRDLTGRGWAVGALLRPAAVAAFTDAPATLRDRYETLAEPGLRAAVAAALDDSDAGRQKAVEVLAAWLSARVGPPGREGLLANRLVHLADSPGIDRVGELAAALAVSERTLQRLATRYVGLSPIALLRRRRLQEAAARIRDEPGVDLAAIATDLGYVDQAHLTNDFVRVLGFTPASYRRES
jgi:AraC-like DNA-binding protein